ncbi:MAG: hypothetical protein H8D87_12995 [Deltaproteobacteria bacterium]|uniref:hypothetical protein n=1 Tax=Desulfobacula sp. TaxID=2593537 RepID=UPI0019955BB6|nr:hypothetical protein [Candidatus Desulfobacula maris]MBL6993061.1 hypothetical protein [Desulfobacula sp.]
MNQIRIASEKDHDKITDLRLTEFSRSKDFKLLKPELLKWNEIDDNNNVIEVLHKGNEVIATIRVIPVFNKKQATHVLECDLPVKISFPALVFNSAVTKKSYQGKGLNQILRYYCLIAAIDHDINTVMSPIYQTAPRIKFMKKLGYQCHTLAHSWQTKLFPNSPRELAVLNRNQFSNAIKIIEKSIPQLIKNYPWYGVPITF